MAGSKWRELRAALQSAFARRRGATPCKPASGSQMESLEARRLLSAVLVKDINQVTAGSGPTNFVDLNGTLFFIAATTPRPVGNEIQIWQSDGTESGTILSQASCCGISTSSPRNLLKFNDTLVFTRSIGSSVANLYIYDGKSVPESFGPQIHTIDNLFNLGGTLFFSGRDSNDLMQLWESDGTTPGTVLLTSYTANSSTSFISPLTSLGSKVFFLASGGLWGADGTLQSAKLITKFSSAAEMVSAGGKLYIRNNNQLWVSDGTPGGAQLLMDFPAAPTNPNQGYNLTSSGGSVFFRANDGVNGTELWTSDGTQFGTNIVADLTPGAADTSFVNFTPYGGKLAFAFSDSAKTFHFSITDGTLAGTQSIRDFPQTASFPFFTTPTIVNGLLYFSASDALVGSGLWKSDGTTADTKKITSQTSSILASSAGTIFLSVFDDAHGTELWKTDGSEVGTLLVKDINTASDSASPSHLTNVNGTLYFDANDHDHYIEPWESDGTDQGTIMIKDILPGPLGSRATGGNPLSLNGTLIFDADDGSGLYGKELWRSDGTVQGTFLLKDLNPGPNGSNFSPIGVANNLGFFITTYTGSRTLWRTDGTPDGTFQLVSSPNGAISRSIALNGVIYFWFDDGTHGTTLWRSDGSPGGTVLLKDINPGRGLPSIKVFGSNGNLFFVGNDGIHGNELWTSDGTEAGTHMVLDIAAGSPDTFSSFFRASVFLSTGNGFYFTAVDRSSNPGAVLPVYLWRTDGTAVGTFKIAQVSTTNQTPTILGAIRDEVFFIPTFSSPGVSIQLWKTNGTAIGTVPILNPKQKGFQATGESGVNLDDKIFFRADTTTPRDGVELWETDGTDVGTKLVRDIYPSAISSDPQNFTVVGNSLFFTASDPGHGNELWKIAPPTASLPTHFYAASNGSIQLDASASIDPDPAETLTYQWDLDGDGIFGETGPAAVHGDEVGVNPTFLITGMNAGDSIPIKLKVTDSVMLSSTASADVVVPDGTLAGSANDVYQVQQNAGGDLEVFYNTPPTGPATFTLPREGLSRLHVTGGTVHILNNIGGLAIDVDGDGSVDMQSTQQPAYLHLHDQARLAYTGPAGLAIRTADLDIGPSARLDLGQGDLILNGVAGQASQLPAVQHALISGRNGGTWNGPGIVSSAAATNVGYTLAAALNDAGNGLPLLKSLDGQAVDINDILVRYTLDGDSNLDGKIDVGDYFNIDRGFAMRMNPGTPFTGFANGDFDYSGMQDADDYFLIDRAFILQGPVQAAAAPPAAKRLVRHARHRHLQSR